MLAVIAGGVAAILLVGIVAGVWAVSRQTGRPRAGALPSLRASTSPASTLEPEQFPYRYMEGLTVTKVIQTVGLSDCTAPQIQRDLMEWTCSRNDGADRYYLTIRGRSENQVNMIGLLISNNTQRPPPERVAPTFYQMAPLPFSSHPDLAQQADTWVRANAAKDQPTRTTAIGSITYGTVVSGDGWFMDIDAGIR
jgi:hypothetical protein